ncbi:hypothetical protein RCZ04_11130 [Capnocytophaga sp. HP1101]
MKALSTLILTLCLPWAISAQRAILPFELLENKYVLLKLSVKGEATPLTFYFDTGATTTILDKSVAEQYGINPNHTQKVEGAGGSKEYQIALSQTINLTPQSSIENVNIVLEDLSRLNNAFEKKFDGIIGNDIIKNYVTKIDFQKRVISLYDLNETVNTEGYTEVPFEFKLGVPIPQFPIRITLQNGEVFEGDVFFDSGAGLSLLINTPYKKAHQLVEKIGKTLVSSSDNLSKKSTVTTGMIQELSVAGFDFKDIPIDLSSDEEGVSAFPNYLGILGSEIINRFDIILNYQTHKLYLRPNNLFAKAFEKPISPISIRQVNNEVVVTRIIENSEAYQKGLREGSKILSIDKNNTGDLEQYRQMLKQKGKTVKIKYKATDSDEVKEIKVRLKELL